MVETLRFQCRGCGFDPWSETRIPRAMWSKTKTNKQNHKVVGDAVGPGGSGHLVIQMLPSAIVPIHRACTSPVPIILCASLPCFSSQISPYGVNSSPDLQAGTARMELIPGEA